MRALVDRSVMKNKESGESRSVALLQVLLLLNKDGKKLSSPYCKALSLDLLIVFNIAK